MSHLTFYYTVDVNKFTRRYAESVPDVPLLLPASSWYRKGMKPPYIPPYVKEKAADCGGFVATFKWGGIYKYTPKEYVDWLSSWNPDWAAMMDYCCENEITGGNPGIVRHRQQKTTKLAYHFWKEYRDMPWQWVPTIQGWNVEDYICHANQLKPLLEEMRSHYGDGWRVGIGTLCARADTPTIKNIVRAIAQILPRYPLHLWGVKLGFLQSSEALHPQIVSVDSAAWDGLAGSRDRAVWEQQFRGTISQRQYSWDIALPRYKAKVEAALNKPKQLSLFDVQDVG